MYCTESGEINNEMDRVKVIDLCSVSQTKNDEQDKGRESAKQESQDKMKTDAINRMEDGKRAIKSKSMTKNKEVETAMMCWEALNDFPKKEPCMESENKEEKPVKKTEKIKTWRRTSRAYSKYRQPTKNLDRRI